jgi:glycosyltransferase involved in cell wall biosynthesis
MTPRVSVLCSVLNGARHLPAAIASIRNQTCSDFEFILINDGSTDETPALLDQAAAEDSRIVVIHQQHLGLTRALNVGLATARAKYVARQDADDLSLPHRLARQLEFLDHHPAHVVVGARYLKIDEEGRVLGRSQPPATDFGIRLRLLNRNAVAHSSAIFQREPVLELGGYDESLPVAQDYDLWCRVAERGKLANLRTIALKRRQHSDQIGVRSAARQLQIRDRVRLRYCKQVLAQTPTGLRGRLLRAAAWLELRGQRATAGS